MRTIHFCILLLSVIPLSCTKQSGPDYRLPPPPFLNLPVVVTASVSGVTNTSASCGGDVTDDGGTPVTAKGICWSTGHNPTIALSTKTTDGTGTGIFSSTLSGLSTGTTYYVRAYASNTLGTAYGNEVGFVATTQPALATLTTLGAVGITTTSASCGGEITSEGNVPVTARGICWSTIPEPTIADHNIPVGSGPGIFTSSITGLAASTTYHVRAYAVNSVGIAYGNNVSFTTNNNIPTPPATVTICGKVWMTKNLDVITYLNGDPIPQVTDPVQWSNLTTGAWAYVNGDPATNGTYGKIYNWYAVNDPRGLTPAGWHVPSETEFMALANCLGGEYIAGGPLKTVGTTDWMAPNTGATNLSGFSALPGGKRSSLGVYSGFGTSGSFWTSTQQSTGFAWVFSLSHSSIRASFLSSGIKEGLAVRCIKD